MYTAHFGCRERPFDITADPRFLYANSAYEEAYAAILYGIRNRRGCIALVGEAGTGKTTLLHWVLQSLEQPNQTVFFDKTTLTFDELLDFICREFDLPVTTGRLLEKIQALNEFLLECQHAGGTGVLIIDEAQNLTDEALENLRLLSNFEAANEKLLQLVLVGQPELEHKLEQSALRQLKQRIVVRCHLDRLPPDDVGPFILHRLRVAGCGRQDIFTPDAVERIARCSTGIPRLINAICDNAMLIAYGARSSTVSKEAVEEAAQALRLVEDASSFVALEERSAMTAHELKIIQRSDATTSSSKVISAPLLFPQQFSRPWLRPALWMLGLVVVAGSLLHSEAILTALRQTAARVVVLGPSVSPLGAEQSAEEFDQQWEEERSSSPAPQLASLPPTQESESPQQASVPEDTTAKSAISDDSSPLPTPSSSANEWKGETITIVRGDTISHIAIKLYGNSNMLAFDLIKELNPHIENLNRIAVGEKILFPALTQETLVRTQPDGSAWLILGAFYSKEEAENLAKKVRRDGYVVTVSQQKVFDSRSLYRVTVEGLNGPAAIEQAWLWVAQGPFRSRFLRNLGPEVFSR
jgi:general secretion pathway protein A